MRIFLLLFLSFCTVGLNAQTTRTLSTELVASIQHRINNHTNPSIVIGIIDKDGPHYFSFGKLKEGGKNANEHSIYEIGSISKVFTATLLADNIIKGEMRVDDPISTYLPREVTIPGFEDKQITLGHLSDHTSSLPRLPSNLLPKDPGNPYADYSVQNLYDFLSTYALTRPIGSEFEYSNLAVGLLGHILSLKACMSYDKLLVDKIATPLGMQETRITLTPAMKKKLAYGHHQDIQVPNWDLSVLEGAGGIKSSVHDMLKFLKANLHPDSYPLGNALKLTHIPRHNLADGDQLGLGWFIGEGKIGDLYIHSGGTGGYRTFAGFNKETGTGVVVLSNSSESVEDIGYHILDPSLPLRTLVPHVALKLKEIIELEGAQDLQARYDKIRSSGEVEYDYSETGLNALGYYYLNRKNYNEALAIFVLNIREYPQSSNVYDSYGEALMETGKTAEAIVNYQKSLELNPANSNAVDMLARMGVKAEIKEVKVDVQTLETYMGVYELFPNFTLTITLENGHLMAQATGQLAYEIFPKSDTEFYYKVVDAQVFFLPDEAGVTNSLQLLQNGQTIAGKRIK